ncbi:MAG: hypothetical protein BroJett011_14800 [Chloroflexota bacterium]|nr:MAG: hypothetical protein BroJett011_14800 [Chloroflexota bacterium]
MSVHSKRILEPVWRLVTGIKESLPLLTAEEQTRLSWLNVIRSFAEVPDVYRSSFEALIGDSQFPYTVLTPSYAGFIKRQNEKLVCYLDGKIHIMEEVTGLLTCTGYAVKDVSYVEAGKVLLQSWVKLSGMADRGLPNTSEFKFNTVTEHLCAPLVEKIRSATGRSQGTDLAVERSKFNFLGRANLKLMNYARRSILPGEQVIASLLQPEIRAKVLTLFNRTFYHTISPAHLSILTDRELILIKEDPEKGPGNGPRYGGLWTYIPLHKIAAVSLGERDPNTLTLSIHLPANDEVSSIFALANRSELEQFVGRLEKMRQGREDDVQKDYPL